MKARHRALAGSAVLLALFSPTWAVSPSPATPTVQRTAGRESIEVALQKGRFVYKADGKRLTDVLKDFTAAQGVPSVVDGRIEGLVSGNFDATSQQFLDAMARAYSLIWYYDGTAMYYYPASSIQSRIFRLKGYSEQQVSSLLSSLRLDSTRFPIRFDRANATLLVYGPPRHVELVGQAIESLDIGAMEGNRRIVRVFRLQYASAGDRMLGSVRIPGVAPMLAGLFGAQGPGNMMGSAQQSANRQMAPLNRMLTGESPQHDSKGAAPGSAQATIAALQGGSGNSSNVGTARPVRSPVDDESENDIPSFQVDEPSNAVIVYARASRMQEIGSLIQALDVAGTLVELEATFIEVATDEMNQLGVEWSLSTDRLSIGSRPPEAAAVDRAGAALLGAPYSLSTLLRDAGRSLLANVNALAGKGKARIVSKPRVLGLANRPATMIEKRIANVRVAGNLEANLFQVEAGTTMQITPQVMPGERGRPATIKLAIYIEDGNFEGASVDNVPVIKRTEVRTEARVLEGESLLVGGISVESDMSSNAGVPYLKTLPFVGGIFRSTMQRKTRVERLFLLTPRVVQALPASDVALPVPPRTSSADSAPPLTAAPPLAQRLAAVPVPQPLPQDAPPAAISPVALVPGRTPLPAPAPSSQPARATQDSDRLQQAFTAVAATAPRRTVASAQAALDAFSNEAVTEAVADEAKPNARRARSSRGIRKP